jgi:hypothetical protein
MLFEHEAVILFLALFALSSPVAALSSYCQSSVPTATYNSCAWLWGWPSSTGTPSAVARCSCPRQARRNITRSESYTLPSAATTSAAAQPFSVMKIDVAPPIDCIWRGAQYMTSGSKTCQADAILGWRR